VHRRRLFVVLTLQEAILDEFYRRLAVRHTQHLRAGRGRSGTISWGKVVTPTADSAILMDPTGFVQALIDDPDDETTPLVLADWLEERGDPRGELVRIQATLRQWVPELPP